jgi:glycosyltransferase involved in cell wall biosynthesis
MRLDIVGDNRTTPRIDLEALVHATDMDHQVHLRSYVSDGDLGQLYAGASAFVFLSDYEGFGLTPLEALASGVPVVLLDTPVAREICGDAAAYITRPDPDVIATALEAVLFDAEGRERMLSAANDVVSRYSWATFSERVLDVLLDAGSRGPEGAARRQSTARQTR